MAQSSDGDANKPAGAGTPPRDKQGLISGAARSATYRPAAGFTVRRPPLPSPRQHETITVKDERGMAVALRKAVERVAVDPEFSVMLAVNPVLALEHYGIKLIPEMRKHVFETFQHPPKVRARRNELEAKLKEALGSTPRVDDPAWLAHALFDQLKLKPLDTAGAQPTYRPPINAGILARLNPVRPKGGRPDYPGERRIKVKAAIGMKPWHEAVRRLDLTAAVPERPDAKERPRTVTLEEAWFYKDLDPFAHDLVELGQIQRMAFPVRTPEAFRKIAAGEQPNAFRSWIREIRLKVRKS